MNEECYKKNIQHHLHIINQQATMENFQSYGEKIYTKIRPSKLRFRRVEKDTRQDCTPSKH